MNTPAETFERTPGWLDWQASPSKPKFTPPPGAVDAHCHVFGPGNEFPFAPERKYTPCDASKHQLFALRDYLGFSRNVLVQASCHGVDNAALLDAIAHSDGKARGVATVPLDIADNDLEALHEGGVRGVRFNFVRRLADPLPADALMALAHRLEALCWHIVVYFEAADLPTLYGFFSSLPTQVIVDHMGRPDTTQPAQGTDFDLFIRLLEENPNVWSKVSCPERISKSGPPSYGDVVPFARRVIETFSDRVLWGTDWPHPNMKSHMPDDGHLVDFIPKIAPSTELHHKLLVDNPMRLYWPEEAR